MGDPKQDGVDDHRRVRDDRAPAGGCRLRTRRADDARLAVALAVSLAVHAAALAAVGALLHRGQSATPARPLLARGEQASQMTIRLVSMNEVSDANELEMEVVSAPAPAELLDSPPTPSPSPTPPDVRPPMVERTPPPVAAARPPKVELPPTAAGRDRPTTAHATAPLVEHRRPSLFERLAPQPAPPHAPFAAAPPPTPDVTFRLELDSRPPLPPRRSEASSPAPAGVEQGVQVIDLPRPRYPALSRRLGEQGVVVLRVHVSAEGRAESVEVVESPPYDRLVDAAIDAAKRAKYEPARRGGRAVAGTVEAPFRFVLEKQ